MASHGGHVGAAYAWRNEVAGDRLGGDQQTPTAQPLDEAVDDELGHGVGGAAQAEPARNRAMATRKRFLRPTRSPSLP